MAYPIPCPKQKQFPGAGEWLPVNRFLASLAGLHSLEAVGGNLVIWYNRKLCTRVAEALKDRLLDSGGAGGSINISMNKPGC